MTDQPRRVLLAEDDRFLRRAAETTLKRQGYLVITAADGEEALRVARSEPLDLILLDMIMPKLNGFEVLNALKRDAQTAQIPVIILSSLGQDRDVQQAMDAGAAAYFIKTDLPLQALVQRVAEVLAGLDGRDAGRRGLGARQPGSDTTTSVTTLLCGRG